MNRKDEIISYLRQYSSKEHPKAIREIAETLSIDEESIGYVIHELKTNNDLGITSSPKADGLLYYLLED